MAKTAQVNARMDLKIKAEAEAVFAQLGITPSQAIKMFYRQVSLRQGLPLSVACSSGVSVSAWRFSISVL